MPQIKPTNPIIDWGNPITKGIDFDYSFFESVGIATRNNGFSRGVGTLTTNSLWKKSPYGSSINFASSSGSYISCDRPVITNPNYVTYQVIYNSASIGTAGDRFFEIQVTPGSNYTQLLFNAAAVRIEFQPGWSTSGGTFSIPLPTFGVYHDLTITYDYTSTSSVPRMFLDNVEQTVTTVVSPSGSKNTEGNYMKIGNRVANDRTFNGDIALLRRWTRILTPNEVKQLYTDPWCIYQKPRFNIINSISAAVTGLRGLISFGMIPFGVAEAPAGITATGGTITDITGYKVHTFTTDGTFEITAGTADVEYLVVGAGGGGGGPSGRGGGGGGGKVKTGTKTALTVGTYTVTVGTGGAGSTAGSVKGVNGEDSVFDTVTSKGGGGGGTGPSSKNGADGGNGGGGGDYAGGGTGGASNDGGYAGGDGLESAPGYGAGGGGGDSAIGTNGTSTSGGNGGNGTASSISGSSFTYGGGGGGAAAGGQTAGAGGTGGGGNGVGAGAPTAGTDGLGGGGGGGCDWLAYNGADGGDGIVIVRYAV
jgi:hypothetical protein